LAPELLEPLENDENNPDYDKNKADVWSLGLCLLSASILRSTRSIYIYSKYKIDELKLKSFLMEAR